MDKTQNSVTPVSDATFFLFVFVALRPSAESNHFPIFTV
jgi:hypothetical protein